MVEQGTRLNLPITVIVDDFTIRQIKVLLDSGFFAIRSGRGIVHFGNNGQIKKITREDTILQEQKDGAILTS